MLIYLFGGYTREGMLPGGRPIQIRFLTLLGAERYGRAGLSTIDPYARFLRGPVKAVPGKLTRRGSRP